MYKLTLGKNQAQNLLVALDIAIGSYYTGEQFEADDAKDRKTYEELRASIERQFGINKDAPIA